MAGREDLVNRFASAIYQELEPLDRPPIDTLFIGGGTPTQLSLGDLHQFLSRLSNCFAIQPNAELTVEANPEDITPEKLNLLVDHGVNRVSLGVQSFDDKKLKALERSHTGDAAKTIICQTADRIPNVSIDLIFGAPCETAIEFESDLTTAFSLPIKHLSTYALTFEKGTPFWNRQYHGEINAVDERVEIEMYQAAQTVAASHGAHQYEVSSFAREGFRCRHNIAYWQGRGWYAAGPGAARFVNGRREVNHRSTTTYLNLIENGKNHIAESESISIEQYARERLAFGIRMLDGVNLQQLNQETGFDIENHFASVFAKLTDQGLIERNTSHLKLTRQGVLFADTVASEFL